MRENDPDCLQLLDESDEKWVALWRKNSAQKSKGNKITLIVAHRNELAVPKQPIFKKHL